MGRRIVIGDIHGCYKVLQRLLDKIGINEDDVLIPVGDMVDGGPDSPEVAQFFMELKSAQPIPGNHEFDHVWQASLPPHERRLSRTKEITLAQCRERYRAGRIRITYEDMISYFRTLLLRPYHNLREAIVVHAGIDSNVPITLQKKEVLLGLGGTKNGCNGKNGGLPPWTAQYPLDAKAAIWGHQAFRKDFVPWDIPQRDNLFPIDGMAVRGGELIAISIPIGADTSNFTVHRVRSDQSRY